MDNPLAIPHEGVTHVGTIKIDPSNIDKFLKAFRQCWLEVCTEPECLYFDVFHSQSEPGIFHLVEVWSRDNDWFMEYQIKKDYYKPYWEATKSMWLNRDFQSFDRLKNWSFVDDRYLAGSVKAKEELK